MRINSSFIPNQNPYISKKPIFKANRMDMMQKMLDQKQNQAALSKFKKQFADSGMPPKQVNSWLEGIQEVTKESKIKIKEVAKLSKNKSEEFWEKVADWAY